MTTRDTFDRTLADWFEVDAASPVPSTELARVLSVTSVRRPLPRWPASVGSHWVEPTPRVRSATGRWPLRPTVEVRWSTLVLVAVTALLLLAGVVLVAALLARPSPQIARNGSIAYSVAVGLFRDGRTHVVGPDGSGDREIADAGYCPVFSRDGMTVARVFSRQAKDTLLVSSPDGSSPRRVAIDMSNDNRATGPFALSPDGTLVAWVKVSERVMSPTKLAALSARNEVWVTPVAAGSGARIVSTPTASNEFYGALAWSPDGRRLAFEQTAVTRSADGIFTERRAVLVVDTDGTHLARLTTRPGAGTLSWSPDGRYLAYLGLPDGFAPASSTSADAASEPPQDVFVIRTDGYEDRDVTNSPSGETEPAWSPDGARLGYLTPSALATLPMAGPARSGSARFGPAGASAFNWSPDGTSLLWANAVQTDGASITTFRTVDRDFLRPPTTLLTVNGVLLCQPTWQRLEP